MAALAAIENLDMKSASLLKSIVNHEQGYWLKRFTNEIDNVNDDLCSGFTRQVSRTIAALTLRDGARDFAEADSLNKSVGGPQHPQSIQFLSRLYPGHSQGKAEGVYLRGLEPDLLGEHLIGRVLADAETPANRIVQPSYWLNKMQSPCG